MTKHINLTPTPENVQYSVGDIELTVERENDIWNYFFFTATSIGYDDSTMVLDFEDISGWEPNGCLVSCNGFEGVYAVKVIIPKFWYLEGESVTRTILAYGRIQTISSSVGSDYSINISTRGCKESALYTLSHENR